MDKITLPGAAGAATIEIDWSEFPESIKAALLAHGLQQKVADSCSAAKANGWTTEQARAACDEALANLKAGTWAKRGGGGPRARDEDSYVASQVRNEVKAKRKAKKEPALSEDALNAHVAFIMESPAHAKWIKAIRAEYAAKQAKREVDIDLSF